MDAENEAVEKIKGEIRILNREFEWLENDIEVYKQKLETTKTKLKRKKKLKKEYLDILADIGVEIENPDELYSSEDRSVNKHNINDGE